MMPELDYLGTQFVYNGHLTDAQAMKLHMSARASAGDEPQWYMPATWEAATQLGETHFLTTKASAKLNDVENQHWWRIDTQTEMAPIYHARTTALQDKGIAWLTGGNSILADQMGTGKTVMAAVAANHLLPSSVLIVTTKSTVGSWVAHVKEWTGRDCMVLHGTPAQRKKAIADWNGIDWVVTTHGMMLKHSAIANWHHLPYEDNEDNWLSEHQWGVMIVDEFHKFRDPKGKTARALKETRRGAMVAWALSGSPIEDNQSLGRRDSNAVAEV